MMAVVALVVVAICALWGARSGGVRVLATVVGIIAGHRVAVTYADRALSFLSGLARAEVPDWAAWAVPWAVGGLVLGAVMAMGEAVSEVMERIPLVGGVINRAAGIIGGISAGLILALWAADHLSVPAVLEELRQLVELIWQAAGDLLRTVE